MRVFSLSLFVLSSWIFGSASAKGFPTAPTDESRRVITDLSRAGFSKEDTQSFNVEFLDSGGCEEHITEFEITNVSMLDSNPFNFKSFGVSLQVVDRTESGRRDGCLALVTRKTVLSKDDLREKIKVFCKESGKFTDIDFDDPEKDFYFSIQLPGAHFFSN